MRTACHVHVRLVFCFGMQACPLFGPLMQRALEVIKDCKCTSDSGCPACIQHTDCGEYNAVLSKQAGIIVLECVLAAEEEYRGRLSLQVPCESHTPATPPSPTSFSFPQILRKPLTSQWGAKANITTCAPPRYAPPSKVVGGACSQWLCLVGSQLCMHALPSRSVLESKISFSLLHSSHLTQKPVLRH